MTLQFPANPILNQIFPDPALPGVGQFQWDGSKWSTAVNVVTPLSTVQRFTSGSGTYTPPPGVAWIRVQMVGGGGGGGGSAAPWANGTVGSSTSFAGWTCLGGGGGAPPSSGSGGNPGAGGMGGTNGAGTFINRIRGGQGDPGLSNQAASIVTRAANGGTSYFGGPYGPGTGGVALGVGAASTGSPGGGGAGEYVEFIVSNPSSSAYVVGAGGTAGTGGGPGSAGLIIVTEHYGRIPTPVAVVQLPTYQTFTAGSGTYSPPNGLTYIRVRMCGGGGGGGSNGVGANGAATVFGSWTCNPGGAGGGTSGGSGGGAGAGGTGGTNGTGTLLTRVSGGRGAQGISNTSSGVVNGAGLGGVTLFGSWPASGAGGIGGFTPNATMGNGGGGGGGEYAEFIVSSPTSASYSVGAGGAGGGANVNVEAGYAGTGGIIIVEEHYNKASLDSLPTSGNGGALLTQNQPVIMGVTNGSDAGPGEVGEVLSAQQTTAVNIVANVGAAVTSLILSPGDWDAVGSASVIAVASTSTSIALGLGSASAIWETILQINPAGTTNAWMGPTGTLRVSNASNVTIFLVASATTAGTATGAIYARRIR